MRQPTVEWQVCGVCNYDCSYCIQSKASRVGHPDDEALERMLEFLASLPGRWEIKMTGGEPFAFKGFMERIVPGLVARTPHVISVLTNLSAPAAILDRFAALTRGRLGVVSASLHLEHVAPEDFMEKARRLRERMDPAARMVVNSVLVPGRLSAVSAARRVVERGGLTFFPQLMKIAGGVAAYDEPIEELVGIAPTPRQANVAPSYRGRRCWSGVEYLVLTQTGDAWSCRTARRHGEGYLGNAVLGTVRRLEAPSPCPYDICPCTVPANRGMIEGVA
jgi:hypothetical protein